MTNVRVWRWGPFLSRLAGEDERGQKSIGMTFEIRTLSPGDHALFEGMLDVFAEAFEDAESYASRRPGPAYVSRLLDSGSFVGLVAVQDGRVIGALAAYELVKFEQ